MAKAAKTKKRHDAFADKFMSDFDAQPAQVTDEQLDKIEADFLGLGKRRSRRTALVTLAMSGIDLTKAVADDRGAALAFAVAQISIKDYAAHLREFADMMDSAQTRIAVALCSRPDMEALLREAKTQAENPGELTVRRSAPAEVAHV